MKKTKRLHLISGPRNISTALMYSFAQRSDTTVVDEPFYGHYLKMIRADHPGKADVLEKMETDHGVVKQEVIFGDYPTDIVFFKDMAHHLVRMELEFLEQLQNIFLIRDPRLLIISLAKVIDKPTMRDVGIQNAWEIFQQLKSYNYVILDSEELLKDPEKVLKELCKQSDIPFDKNMLSWKAGARPEDGIWAKYWYKNVHLTTGFEQKITDKAARVPDDLQPLLEECMPYYKSFKELAIKA